LAWQSTPASSSGNVRRLYKASWINPNPGAEISHVSMENSNSTTRLALVAITAE
jgi:hypothetical protein